MRQHFFTHVVTARKAPCLLNNSMQQWIQIIVFVVAGNLI